MARQFISILLVAALLPMSATAIAENSEADRPITEVPFKLRHGSMVVVQGTIGELNKLNLLIDTGALFTVVDQKIAVRLQVEGSTVTAAGFFGGNQGVQEAALLDLKIGRAVFPSVSALVTDLSSLGFPGGIHVIVGLDLLKRASFSIDYEAKIFSMGRVQPFETGAQLETDSPYFTAKIDVQGRALRLMMDTGADNIVLFGDRVQEKLDDLKMRKVVTLNHLQGTSYAREVELKEVSLGAAQWKRLPAVILGTGSPAELEIDGLVGPVSLGIKRIQFDFVEQHFSWER